jgi:hypothetical protein
MVKNQPSKGATAEEALRAYFLESGYFVVRGIKVRHGKLDVTDIDAWLYARASALHRVRTNVDAKNKGTPKAMERILWARGVQEILSLDHAIVATTDSRPIVEEFGAIHGVQVLGGAFLGQLIQRYNATEVARITEEEFWLLVAGDGLDRLQGGWFERLETSKSRLLDRLDFSSCNAWLEDARHFIDALGAGRRGDVACRCAYLVLSFFFLGLDFRLAPLAFEPAERRRQALLDGFEYGEGGRDRLRATTDLVRRFRPDVARELTANLPQEPTPRAAILTEYFGKADTYRTLFALALQFEAMAFGASVVHPGKLPLNLMGPFGVILDALQLDRRQFLDA